MVGLEIKREIIVGELANLRKAMLPIAAAVGGMAFPAIIYYLINSNSTGVHGWGIPMATDIAFVVGCIAVLRKWIPPSLLMFIVALAIVDDLGAVCVIAIFYTEKIAAAPLLIGSFLILISFVMGFFRVRAATPLRAYRYYHLAGVFTVRCTCDYSRGTACFFYSGDGQVQDG